VSKKQNLFYVIGHVNHPPPSRLAIHQVSLIKRATTTINSSATQPIGASTQEVRSAILRRCEDKEKKRQGLKKGQRKPSEEGRNSSEGRKDIFFLFPARTCEDLKLQEG